MTVFADASALVKAYLDEDHSHLIRALIASPGGVALSRLTRVELVSALWRRERTGALPADDARALADSFEVDMLGNDRQDPLFALVDLHDPTLEAAVEHVARHGLRAGDAIQLASAVAARDADPECTAFACFDLRLREAAAREGFALVPAAL